VRSWTGAVWSWAWCAGSGWAGAEREGLVGGAERVTDRGGDGVAIVLGGDADQVPGGRFGAEDLGDAGERDQLAQLRCPPDLPAPYPGGKRLGRADRAAVDAQLGGQVVVVPLTGLRGNTPWWRRCSWLVGGRTHAP
jgi:hypothetical protein